LIYRARRVVVIPIFLLHRTMIDQSVIEMRLTSISDTGFNRVARIFLRRTSITVRDSLRVCVSFVSRSHIQCEHARVSSATVLFSFLFFFFLFDKSDNFATRWRALQIHAARSIMRSGRDIAIPACIGIDIE